MIDTYMIKGECLELKMIVMLSLLSSMKLYWIDVSAGEDVVSCRQRLQ